MRLFKKMNAALALALTLALVAPVVTPVTNVAVAEAATIKLNKKKKNLKVGKSFKLKVKGTSEKASYISSDETIAKVDKKGKVTAVSAGKATITATVADNELTCKVTVKGSVNPAVANAPFEAKEVVAEGYSFASIANWVEATESVENVYVYGAGPTETSPSTLTVLMTYTGTEALEYELLKETLVPGITEESLISTLQQQGFDEAELSNLLFEDVEAPIGTAFKYSYDAIIKNASGTFSYQQCQYIFMVDDYIVYVTGTAFEDGTDTAPIIMEVTDYIVQSFMKK